MTLPDTVVPVGPTSTGVTLYVPLARIGEDVPWARTVEEWSRNTSIATATNDKRQSPITSEVFMADSVALNEHYDP
jgi:hypothetical protein